MFPFFIYFCLILLQTMYAKAIYDNIAECPDELAFKRGDLLTVIEQDTDGLEGWWLCTLRGRQVSEAKIFLIKKKRSIFMHLIEFINFRKPQQLRDAMLSIEKCVDK